MPGTACLRQRPVMKSEHDVSLSRATAEKYADLGSPSETQIETIHMLLAAQEVLLPPHCTSLVLRSIP